jgi:hypothetical protein
VNVRRACRGRRYLHRLRRRRSDTHERLRNQVFCRFGAEFFLAAAATEVIRLALMLVRPFRSRGIDRHSAYRIPFN